MVRWMDPFIVGRIGGSVGASLYRLANRRKYRGIYGWIGGAVYGSAERCMDQWNRVWIGESVD